MVIVVTILGLLVAIALPTYRQARNAALIGSVIGDLISYAKACAVINASGVGETPTPPAISAVRGGVTVLEGCDGASKGGKLEASWGDVGADGIACLSSRSSLSHRKALMVITNINNDNSTMTCTFSVGAGGSG